MLFRSWKRSAAADINDNKYKERYEEDDKE